MGHKIGKLYVVDCKEKVGNEIVCTAVEPSKNKIWHSRFGHLGGKNLKKLVEENLVEGGENRKVKKSNKKERGENDMNLMEDFSQEIKKELTNGQADIYQTLDSSANQSSSEF